jgi:hypothetical protein
MVWESENFSGVPISEGGTLKLTTTAEATLESGKEKTKLIWYH